MRKPKSPVKAADVCPIGRRFQECENNTGESMKRFFAFVIVATMSMPLFAADGAAIFKAKCAGCHGADGSKAIPAMGVKPLTAPEAKAKSLDQVVAVITKGQGKMKPIAVSPEEAKAVAGFVKTLK
jgi:mono/diheme cytochrome c family protein